MATQQKKRKIEPKKFDVVIVGAGISGISAAWHLQKHCPNLSYALLEGRAAMGGTWDLFRYPGIRSDSDMQTMGFSFKPWTDPKIISDGTSIREYICETADESGITPNIHYKHKLLSAVWASEDATWTLVAQVGRKKVTIECNFLHMCNGYYNYDKGYLPEFKGYGDFKGEIIHPQQWPEKLAYEGKRVVIIGSGATAVTLLPSMANKTAHITMLQRSPTYMVSRPSIDGFIQLLQRIMPATWAYRIARMRNILLQRFFYWNAQRRPQKMKEIILNRLRKELGDEFDIDKHFTPSYNPWDQRMCLVPDSDFFNVLKDGSASVVTDTIEKFTETGIQLDSGEHLEADIIVTATGLNMQILHGIDFQVDGKPMIIKEHIVYKGAMLSNVPNMVFTMGYSNASWTLKADLISAWVSRLLKYMHKHNYNVCLPALDSSEVSADAVMNLHAGYVLRALDRVPRQGNVAPWKLLHNYLLDRIILSVKSVADGVLEFSHQPGHQPKKKDTDPPSSGDMPKAA